MRRLGTALVTLLVVAACSFRTPPPPGASGEEIYRLQNCANCHGEAGEGKSLGPPLRGLSAHWDRERLARFFADPKPFVAEDARVAELLRKYPAPMSRYDNLDREQRLVLADWVLGL